MLARGFSYTYIMKRCHFVIFTVFLPENISKSASFRSKGSEVSDAQRVPKTRDDHGRGGGGGGGGGSARPGPVPGPARVFCAMAETPAERRKAPVSSAAKAHKVLANDNQPTSQLLV